MKLGAGIQRMSPRGFGDPLILYLAKASWPFPPPQGRIFHLSSETQCPVETFMVPRGGNQKMAIFWWSINFPLHLLYQVKI